MTLWNDSNKVMCCITWQDQVIRSNDHVLKMSRVAKLKKCLL